MSRPLRVGVLGSTSFVATAAVIPAMERSASVEVVALGSRRGATSYDDVLADPAVEAVYVPLPNGEHRRWTERAASSGKHVLCEKPLAASTVDAEAMRDACASAGVLLAEAWMTPFSPRWRDALDRARRGELGELREVRGEFTFTIGDEHGDNYRWDPGQGGGALLDVGIYTLGPAVELWGPDVEVVEARSDRTATGVDVRTEYVVAWPGGRRATGLVSFADPEHQRLELRGTDGSLVLDDEPHTSDPDVDPYQEMVEAFAAAARDEAPWPRPVEASVALLGLLGRVDAAARG